MEEEEKAKPRLRVLSYNVNFGFMLVCFVRIISCKLQQTPVSEGVSQEAYSVLNAIRNSNAHICCLQVFSLHSLHYLTVTQGNE